MFRSAPIRKAIDELVAEKILVRQQGRGTFVTTHSEDRQLYYFFQHRRQGRRQGAADTRAAVVSGG